MAVLCSITSGNALLTSVERPLTIVSEPLAVVEPALTVVREPLTVVELALTVVREPLTVVEPALTVVEEPLTVVEPALTTVKELPSLQALVRLFSLHCFPPPLQSKYSAKCARFTFCPGRLLDAHAKIGKPPPSSFQNF